MKIQDVLPQVIEIARAAGTAIMPYYIAGNTIYKKVDDSPVTDADRVANTLIVGGLQQITPDIPIVSEEGEQPDVSAARYFWLVDPLDGTKSFIRRSGYFTVNIALIEGRNKPVLGVIYEPVNDIMYYGSDAGAFRMSSGSQNRLELTGRISTDSALVSHSHLSKATEAYLAQRHIKKRIPCSSSIKFCMLAEGKADIYPRFGPTMEWDVAAGHAILNAAGGKITTPEGKPFMYGKPRFLNGDFIAFSSL